MSRHASKARKHFNAQRMKLRLAALEKTGAVCVYCGGLATSSDHVEPLRIVGIDGNVIENLVPACIPCNAAKNDLVLNDFRTKRKLFCDSHGPTFVIVRKPTPILPVRWTRKERKKHVQAAFGVEARKGPNTGRRTGEADGLAAPCVPQIGRHSCHCPRRTVLRAVR